MLMMVMCYTSAFFLFAFFPAPAPKMRLEPQRVTKGCLRTMGVRLQVCFNSLLASLPPRQPAGSRTSDASGTSSDTEPRQQYSERTAAKDIKAFGENTRQLLESDHCSDLWNDFA